ncbi:condensation domain-containing protein, partial [Nocardia sienata]|uniref:condensation domain-containing protein n=1 Tax=Nocardia sienata TaxID=248552 RepID=UPI001FE20292
MGGWRRPVLVARERPERVPLSWAQQRMWFINQFDTGSAAYNIPAAIRLTGELDVAALGAALADVLARHEALRTVFPDPGDGPVQVVVAAGQAVPDLTPVQVADPSGLPELLAEVASTGFDVTTEVPIRARLLRLAPQVHVLALVVHHIAADGVSMAPLARDLGIAYTARSAGAAPGWAPLAVQYADYTLWQREWLGSETDPDSAAAHQLRYWRQALTAVPQLLALPTDRPRPPQRSLRGAVVEFDIGASCHQGLVRLARRHRASLFMTMHAVLSVLLARLSGSDDITVGTATAGRGEAVLDDVVGMFVNTLVLRTRVESDQSFSELLEHTRTADLGAFGHAEVPFERVVDELAPTRSAAHAPLFQVVLQLQDPTPVELELPGLAVHTESIDTAVAKFDLQLSVTEEFTQDHTPAGMRAEFTFATDLFDTATVHTFADRFLRIAETVSTDATIAVGDIDILTP